MFLETHWCKSLNYYSSSFTSKSVLPGGHSPCESPYSISTTLFSFAFRDFNSQLYRFWRLLTFLSVDASCAFNECNLVASADLEKSDPNLIKNLPYVVDFESLSSFDLSRMRTSQVDCCTHSC